MRVAAASVLILFATLFQFDSGDAAAPAWPSWGDSHRNSGQWYTYTP